MSFLKNLGYQSAPIAPPKFNIPATEMFLYESPMVPHSSWKDK